MASPFDMHQFNAKERNAARKDLLKKIEVYNKQMRRKKEPSFPLSSPTVVSLSSVVQTNEILIHQSNSFIYLIRLVIDFY